MDRLRNFRKAATMGVLVGLALLASPLRCQGGVVTIPVKLMNTNPLPMILTNSSSNPVPMMDVFSLGQQPVTADLFFNPEPVPRYPIYTVPTAKRLVIEFLSHRTQVSAGDLPDLQLIVNTGGSLGHFIEVPLAKTGSVGGTDYYSGGGPVKIYADAGSTVTLQTGHLIPQGSGPSGLLTICGYLIDLP
jgi:hypothetical protein